MWGSGCQKTGGKSSPSPKICSFSPYILSKRVILDKLKRGVGIKNHGGDTVYVCREWRISAVYFSSIFSRSFCLSILFRVVEGVKSGGKA